MCVVICISQNPIAYIYIYKKNLVRIKISYVVKNKDKSEQLILVWSTIVIDLSI